MKMTTLEQRIKNSQTNLTYGYHVFSNENRRMIFREITHRQCQTSSSIASLLGLDVKVVNWHLKKLVEERYVDIWVNGRNYYYVPGLMRIDDLPVFRMFNSREARKIALYAVRGCRDIKKIPVAKTTLYRYLTQFAKMGLLYLKGYERKYVCGTDEFKTMIEIYDKIGVDYKHEFLKCVESKGFSAKIVGTVNYELKVEINGLENFTMGIFISPMRTAMEVQA